MKTLRHFWSILDFHTLLLVTSTLFATFLCHVLHWEFNIPTDLIGIAIIFPIVFSINAAYSRREKALELYAKLKAEVSGIYFAFRDWHPANSIELKEESTKILLGFFSSTRSYLVESNHDKKLLENVYKGFSTLSRLSVKYRDLGISTSEISMVEKSITNMIEHFEQLKNILMYRTPVSLRAYSHVFLNIFPLFFAPYFAYLGDTTSPVLGYLVGGMYALILVSLDNIQDHLENPFDQEGADDLKLEGGEYISFISEER